MGRGAGGLCVRMQAATCWKQSFYGKLTLALQSAATPGFLISLQSRVEFKTQSTVLAESA